MNESPKGGVACSQRAQLPGSGRLSSGQRRGCGLAGGWAHCSGPGGGGGPGSCGLTSGRPPPAVQEERQRGKDRGEGEAEPTSSANEDMPVEKVLEAELAVEPKTETYVEASVGLSPGSVSAPPTPVCSALGAGPWECARDRGAPHHPITAPRLGARLGGGPPSSPPTWEGDPIITPLLGVLLEGSPSPPPCLGAHLEGDPVTPRPTSMRLCCPSGG